MNKKEKERRTTILPLSARRKSPAVSSSTKRNPSLVLLPPSPRSSSSFTNSSSNTPRNTNLSFDHHAKKPAVPSLKLISPRQQNISNRVFSTKNIGKKRIKARKEEGLELLQVTSHVDQSGEQLELPHSITEKEDASIVPSISLLITEDDMTLSTTSSRYSDRYKLVREIGTGGFGKVYEAKDKKREGKRVAIKKVFCQTVHKLNTAMEEVKSVLNLKHDNIATYIDSFLDDSTTEISFFILCIVMELYRGDLGQMLEVRRSLHTHISEKDIIRFSIDIMSGIKYLHDHSLIHRDLKPANIFLCEKINPEDDDILQTDNHSSLSSAFPEKIQLKIGDFGLVKNVEDSFAETTAGTQIYMAPELFDNRPYSKACDIWSFGCILLELCKLTLDKKLQYMQLLLKGENGFHLEVETHLAQLNYSRELSSIIQNCLRLDPAERYSARDILEKLNELL